ncbi:MAG: hypothetical protein AB7F86_16290 [Bdellovibrionales bacterium]
MRFSQKLFSMAILLSSLVPLTSFGVPTETIEPRTDCQSAREYITAHGFLKSHADLGINPDQQRQIASRVASGCTGAAGRFISVFETLQRLELGGHDSLTHAEKIAHLSDAHAKTFLYVLRTAYLKEYLDLDLATSLKWAKELSNDYKGNVKNAEQDFRDLVEFCQDRRGLSLSPAQCGPIAGRITKANEEFTTPVAPAFKKLFTFLRTESSLNMTVEKALEQAEKIARISPSAPDNFILAYQYGIRGRGLDLAASDGLTFASQIAQKTVESTNEAKRKPAQEKP